VPSGGGDDDVDVVRMDDSRVGGSFSSTCSSIPDRRDGDYLSSFDDAALARQSCGAQLRAGAGRTCRRLRWAILD
jgi:hypothetical protein